MPHGEHWRYELKFDGYRGIAIKDGNDVRLFSRNGRDLSRKFARISDALKELTTQSAIVDGEIVCRDERGRPCFENLQNSGSELRKNLFFYAFDLLLINGVKLEERPIEERKERLRKLLPKQGPLRLSDFIDCDAETLVAFAKENRLEGIVAKRTGSCYEPGKRSGAWTKFKTYQSAEFFIGGYLPGRNGVESLAVGFMRENVFRYAGRVEVYLKGNRLAKLCNDIKSATAGQCPFERIPIKRPGDTWSVGLTEHNAANFVWVKPKAKVTVRFTEWTRIGLLRHAGLSPNS